MPDLYLAPEATVLWAACTAAEAVGDAVYLTSAASSPPTVRRCDPRDFAKMPAVAVIVAKPSATTCRMVIGGLAALPGLVTGVKYFVGVSGQVTAGTPEAGGGPVLVQRIGAAWSPSNLLVQIQPIPTKKIQ